MGLDANQREKFFGDGGSAGRRYCGATLCPSSSVPWRFDTWRATVRDSRSLTCVTICKLMLKLMLYLRGHSDKPDLRDEFFQYASVSPLLLRLRLSVPHLRATSSSNSFETHLSDHGTTTKEGSRVWVEFFLGILGFNFLDNILIEY